MNLTKLVDEDFVNYKKPDLYIGFPTCTFKCDKECGKKVCQNKALSQSPLIPVTIEEIVSRYVSNPITKSIVMGGLEPLDSMNDLQNLITKLREKTQDDIVVFTGYWENEPKSVELVDFIHRKGFHNIIIKFGRFVPGEKSHYDEVLGIYLASEKQKGVIIS